MRVEVVDPSAYTPPYDHALCAALARAGAEVKLVTSRFAYGDATPLPGYQVDERFYRLARGDAGSRVRRAVKALEHVPDMLSLPPLGGRADVVHFQWLTMQWLDGYLLPRRVPVVLTAHDLLPREPRPGQARAQRRLYERVDAIVVHSQYGRGQLVDRLGVDPGQGPRDPPRRVRRTWPALRAPCRSSPRSRRCAAPVVLFFGLLRPYKGIETLLRGVAGRRRGRAVDRGAAADGRPATCAALPAFVSCHGSCPTPSWRRSSAAPTSSCCPTPRTERFDFSGVLATALDVRARDRGQRRRRLRRGGGPGAARLVAPDDPGALRGALTALLDDPAERERLGAAALAAARAPTRGTRPRARRWRYTGRSAPATAGCERLSTSALTSGATSVPNSSIERSTSRCATAPTLIWPT